MRKEFFGITSLLLVGIAALVATLTIASTSAAGAVLYLLILILCPFGILLAYCTKCRSSDSCSHVLPGYIVGFLPKRQPNNYKLADNLVMTACLATIILYPQLWLIVNYPALILYWILVTAGFIMVYLSVCSTCKNSICILCPNRS